jgi:hemoglobin
VRPISLAKPELARLYRNVGAEEGLTRILRDFYRRMSQDLMIGFFFDGKDTDHIADQQKTFLMRAMGATASYSGKAPAQAHDKIPPILAGHFDRRVKILEETLRAHGLSDEDIRTWTAFERAFREQIVVPERGSP